MQLKKNEKRMLIVLGVVVAIAIPFQLLTGRKKPAVVQKTKEQITATVNRVGIAVASSKAAGRPVAAEWFDTWGRDPFSSPEIEREKIAAQRAAARLVLKGIFWTDGKPFAMINDVVLAEGQEKKGIRVDRIEGRKVICRRGGQLYTLQWSQSK